MTSRHQIARLGGAQAAVRPRQGQSTHGRLAALASVAAMASAMALLSSMAAEAGPPSGSPAPATAGIINF